jgi:ubiquinone/menaquinone biosynthesis C-methylase UbiE
MRFRWRPEQSAEPEWMDTPGHPPEVITDNLNDLRRVNRILGGVRLTLLPLTRLERNVPAGVPMRVLDVGTGGADIPRATARWAGATHRPMWLVASDLAESIIAAASACTPQGTGIVFVVADATRLPFRDAAFHAAVSSLTLHHMLPHEARRMLEEMRRCASLGVVVNDIVRSWLTYFGAILAAHLGSRNPLTRHDGPLSARRAYTTEEMADLACAAGLRPVRWDSFAFYRVAMSAVPAVPAHHDGRGGSRCGSVGGRRWV